MNNDTPHHSARSQARAGATLLGNKPSPDRAAVLPGTERPRRFMQTYHYELLVCGVPGHELVGTDARRLRDDDALVAREGDDGVRWYRCLRCDSWLPLAVPQRPARDYPPTLEVEDLRQAEKPSAFLFFD